MAVEAKQLVLSHHDVAKVIKEELEALDEAYDKHSNLDRAAH